MMRPPHLRTHMGHRQGATFSSQSPAGNPLSLLDVKRVTELTTLSRSKIYAAVAEGRFPAPLKLGRKCTRWQAGAVDAWLRSLAEPASDAAAQDAAA